jgi:O-antigen/teichoic acid export membrane protein
MNNQIKKKATLGFIWSAFDRLGYQVLHFIIAIIIARQLSPEDYGLIGMLTIFLVLANTFVDSGLGEALIQKQNPTEKDFNSVFVYNLFASSIIYIILFLCAPLISSFFNEPQLTLITRVLSLGIPFSSLSLVQITLLKKQLDFKSLTKLNLISYLISGSLSILMAYGGYGVWALVIQSVLGSALKTIIIFIMVKWIPVLKFNKHQFRILFGFSSKLLISWIVSHIFNNIYSVIIAKFYTVSQLGYYTQARRLQEIPSNTINLVFQSVSFPVLAELNNTQGDVVLKNAYRKLVKLVVQINIPLMVFLIAISKPLIIVLLTSKWEPSIEFFQLFCVIGIIYPLASINLNITKVKNRTRRYLNLTLVKRALLIVALLLTLNISIIAMIIGQLVATYLALIIELKYSGSLINYKLKEQFLDFTVALLIGGVLGVFLFIPLLYISNYYILLGIQIIIAALVFVGMNWLIKTELYKEVLTFVKKK